MYTMDSWTLLVDDFTVQMQHTAEILGNVIESPKFYLSGANRKHSSCLSCDKHSVFPRAPVFLSASLSYLLPWTERRNVETEVVV